MLAGNLLGLAAVLAAACFLGALPSTAALVVTLMLLRPSAGGAHCGNSFNCNLLGFLLIPPLGLGAAWMAAGAVEAQMVFPGVSFMVALWGIIWNAPYLTRNKPRAESRRKQLKTRALILAILVFAASLWLIYLGHPPWGAGLAAGLLFQGFMLLPAGIYFVHKFDILINMIATRLGGDSR